MRDHSYSHTVISTKKAFDLADRGINYLHFKSITTMKKEKRFWNVVIQ